MWRGWPWRHIKARDIPDALWQATVARYPFLSAHSPADLTALRTLCSQFLALKEFHGARGFVVTDAVALAIAAQAVLPVQHLGLDWYDDFVGIVVHPGQVVARRQDMDEAGVVHDWSEVISGEAMEGGPVMLSWDDVAQAGQSAVDGYNVVIHEFAHKLDMRDGRADGCPPLRRAKDRAAWQSTMAEVYAAFREQVIIAERFGGEPPWMDSYGAQSIEEFFAVASEAYFVNRPRFAADFAPLLPLFDGFYGPPRANPRGT